MGFGFVLVMVLILLLLKKKGIDVVFSFDNRKCISVGTGIDRHIDKKFYSDLPYHFDFTKKYSFS